MSLAVISLLSWMIVLSGVEQKPSQADVGLARAALIKELTAHADGMLAKENVQLADEDRKALHNRISGWVSRTSWPPSQADQDGLRSSVERAVRIIVGATRNPDLADLAIEFTERAEAAPASGASGAATPKTGTAAGPIPAVKCYSSKTFEQLVAQASKVAAKAPNSSRLDIALAALLTSAKERATGTSSGRTCVELYRVHAVQEELDALLSQPAPNEVAPQAPAGVGGASLGPSRSSGRSPSPAVTQAQPTATGLKVPTKGIVQKLLDALCRYPFCN